MYWPEKYQLGIIRHHLEEEGYTYEFEANLYSLIIDVVAENGDETIAIEMKSQDFKRGIKQAQRNTNFVDRSYLSVWEENVTEELVDRFDDLDIGLLSVKDEVQYLSPSKIKVPNPHARKCVLERVNSDV